MKKKKIIIIAVVLLIVVGGIIENSKPKEEAKSMSITKAEVDAKEAKEKVEKLIVDEKINKSKEINQYLRKLEDDAMLISEQTAISAGVMKKGIGYIKSETGTYELSMSFALTKSIYEEIEKINVPKECQELQNKWMEIKKLHFEAINLYVYGLDNINPSSIKQGNELIKQCTVKMEEVTIIKEKLQNQFPRQ